jgi:hypothetical protein
VRRCSLACHPKTSRPLGARQNRFRSGILARVRKCIAVCILTLSACSHSGHTIASAPAPTTSDRTTNHETQGVASRALDGRDPISEITAPRNGYEVIGDAVALVTSATSATALQTSATRDTDPSQRLFAKNGLLVRTNTRSEFIVPTSWHNRLSFRWGNAGPQVATEHLVVGPCHGAAGWIAFPGGYLVADPACVNFIFRTADGDHRVMVGVGAPCDGQNPPPQPTDK